MLDHQVFISITYMFVHLLCCLSDPYIVIDMYVCVMCVWSLTLYVWVGDVDLNREIEVLKAFEMWY